MEENVVFFYYKLYVMLVVISIFKIFTSLYIFFNDFFVCFHCPFCMYLKPNLHEDDLQAFGMRLITI